MPYVARDDGVKIYWEEAGMEPPGPQSAHRDQKKQIASG